MQAVCDEDDCDPSLGHSADRSKKRFRLFLGKNRGGLIEDQDPELLFGEFSCDLRKLFVTYRHAVDHHVLIDRDTHLLDRCLRSVVHLLAVKSIESVPEHF